MFIYSFYAIFVNFVCIVRKYFIFYNFISFESDAPHHSAANISASPITEKNAR